MKSNNKKSIILVFLAILTVFCMFSISNFNNRQPSFKIDKKPTNQAPDEYILPGPISDHIWSPDGSQVAYIKSPTGLPYNCEFWIADKNPSSTQLVNHQLIYTGTDHNGLLDWKDDWILFRIRFEEGTPSSYYGREELWKIRTNGSDMTQITYTFTNGIRNKDMWRPNRGSVEWGLFVPGTNLVYFSAHDGNGWYKGFVCNDDGTDNWQHRSDPDYSFTVGMSPTGNRLLWGHATYWDNPTTFRSCNVDGSGRNTIKSLSYRASPLVLSDGNTLVWHGNDNIYAINMDGTNERTVIDDSNKNRQWNYNPVNGQELIMGSGPTVSNMNLYRINVDGTGIEQLTDGPYIDDFPEYSPDGNYLMYRRLPSGFDKENTPQPWPYDLVIKSLIPLPTITIESPTQDEFYSNTAPDFQVSVFGDSIDTTWYTIDEGITNITFTGLTGIIDQIEWDKNFDGMVNLRFYINDTLGNESYSEVSIYKDTTLPIITINSPIESEIFGTPAPNFDLTVTELNIDEMWYTIDNGMNNISFSGTIGTIDQTEWNKKGNGTLIIQFYAKDKGGNEALAEVTIIKESSNPFIVINNPLENEFFGFNAPSYNISIIEPDLDISWYTLDDGVTNITFSSLTGTIDQTEWDKKGSGTILIKFYAQDTLGNIGYAEVTVEKDITSPLIQINSPTSTDVFGQGAPNFDVTITDSYLDSMWYTIDNGLTNFPLFSLTGTIDQTEWDKRGSGTVPIRFYANDTMGNVNYKEVIITKDLISPLVIINSPFENEIFGSLAPSFDILVLEMNLNYMWYTLDNGLTNIPIISFTGTIDQTEWNKKGTGIVSIKFYAMDEGGNLGFTEVNVEKDIDLPIIIINTPIMNNFYGPNAPHFDLSIQEPNIDLMWYTLDFRINSVYFNDFTGTIDQTEWDKFGNGTVIIRFYVRDKGGNEAYSETIVKKDIVAPVITIITPEIGDIFLDFPPIYSITVDDPNLDSIWFTLDQGITNTSITDLTGVIDLTPWESIPDGHTTLKFYAIDKAGNIGEDSVIITKRSTPDEIPPLIPGYDLFIVIGILAVASLVLYRKWFKK